MNYVGTELELFQYAVHWKGYWSSNARPFVAGRVLNVGCGFGVNPMCAYWNRCRNMRSWHRQSCSVPYTAPHATCTANISTRCSTSTCWNT